MLFCKISCGIIKWYCRGCFVPINRDSQRQQGCHSERSKESKDQPTGLIPIHRVHDDIKIVMLEATKGGRSIWGGVVYYVLFPSPKILRPDSSGLQNDNKIKAARGEFVEL